MDRKQIKSIILETLLLSEAFSRTETGLLQNLPDFRDIKDEEYNLENIDDGEIYTKHPEMSGKDFSSKTRMVGRRLKRFFRKFNTIEPKKNPTVEELLTYKLLLFSRLGKAIGNPVLSEALIKEAIESSTKRDFKDADTFFGEKDAIEKGLESASKDSRIGFGADAEVYRQAYEKVLTSFREVVKDAVNVVFDSSGNDEEAVGVIENSFDYDFPDFDLFRNEYGDIDKEKFAEAVSEEIISQSFEEVDINDPNFFPNAMNIDDYDDDNIDDKLRDQSDDLDIGEMSFEEYDSVTSNLRDSASNFVNSVSENLDDDDANVLEASLERLSQEIEDSIEETAIVPNDEDDNSDPFQNLSDEDEDEDQDEDAVSDEYEYSHGAGVPYLETSGVDYNFDGDKKIKHRGKRVPAKKAVKEILEDIVQIENMLNEKHINTEALTISVTSGDVNRLMSDFDLNTKHISIPFDYLTQLSLGNKVQPEQFHTYVFLDFIDPIVNKFAVAQSEEEVQKYLEIIEKDFHDDAVIEKIKKLKKEDIDDFTSVIKKNQSGDIDREELIPNKIYGLSSLAHHAERYGKQCAEFYDDELQNEKNSVDQRRRKLVDASRKILDAIEDDDLYLADEEEFDFDDIKDFNKFLSNKDLGSCLLAASSQSVQSFLDDSMDKFEDHLAKMINEVHEQTDERMNDTAEEKEARSELLKGKTEFYSFLMNYIFHKISGSLKDLEFITVYETQIVVDDDDKRVVKNKVGTIRHFTKIFQNLRDIIDKSGNVKDLLGGKKQKMGSLMAQGVASAVISPHIDSVSGQMSYDTRDENNEKVLRSLRFGFLSELREYYMDYEGYGFKEDVFGMNSSAPYKTNFITLINFITNMAEFIDKKYEYLREAIGNDDEEAELRYSEEETEINHSEEGYNGIDSEENSVKYSYGVESFGDDSESFEVNSFNAEDEASTSATATSVNPNLRSVLTTNPRSKSKIFRRIKGPGKNKMEENLSLSLALDLDYDVLGDDYPINELIEESRKRKRRRRAKDPAVGTGKKPKGSGRRLYTDENPKDTVSVSFRSVAAIRKTLSKKSFKSKSHKRQSQIINLIHQRARAAYKNAKDPKTKARLKKAYEYATKRKEASKRKTKRMRMKNEAFTGYEGMPKNLNEAMYYLSGDIMKDADGLPLDTSKELIDLAREESYNAGKGNPPMPELAYIENAQALKSKFIEIIIAQIKRFEQLSYGLHGSTLSEMEDEFRERYGVPMISEIARNYKAGKTYMFETLSLLIHSLEVLRLEKKSGLFIIEAFGGDKDRAYDFMGVYNHLSNGYESGGDDMKIEIFDNLFIAFPEFESQHFPEVMVMALRDIGSGGLDKYYQEEMKGV